jgi:type VI secretion system protein ImpK
MNLVPYNESFLVSQFREFYTEVIYLKGIATGVVFVAPPENGSSNGKGDPVETSTRIYVPEIQPVTIGALGELGKNRALTLRNAPTGIEEYLSANRPLSEHTELSLKVWRSLLEIFRRQTMQVLRVSGGPTQTYYEAQYVMAAFADDIFIHLDWEGKWAWTSNLLESTLFHSHVAGQRFFDNLDRLLRDGDPAERSLGAVYLTALSLGFRGKYYDEDDRGELGKYRRRLFNFVFQHESDLEDELKIAFPDAYIETVRREKKKLTNPRLWVGVLCLVILSYLAVSEAVWWTLTYELKQQIHLIECQLDLSKCSNP